MSQTTEKNWADLKAKILGKWTKFNDHDVESVRGDLRQLAGKIEKTYGVAKDMADKQYADFRQTSLSLIHDFTSRVDASVAAQVAVQDSESATPTLTRSSQAI
jgi:uncharacterized protein YjbJ (UPF0337 family)